MLLVGLTGGIASGKSTVSNRLRALGACVIDADILARDVVAKGSEGLARVVERFGPNVLTPDGSLDRKVLGERVFANEADRKALEAITHPLIFARFQALSSEAEARGEKVCVYDAPLLFERKLHLLMNQVIVVFAPREVQKARLMQRDGLNEAQAEQRLAAQMPLAEKRALATFVIDNSESLESTLSQVDTVWKQLKVASSVR